MKRLMFFVFCCLLPLTQEIYSLEYSTPSSINETQFNLVYKNIFQFKIYDDYMKQLRAFMQSELQKTKSLNAALQSPPKNSTPFVEEGLAFLQKLFDPLPVIDYEKVLYHESIMQQLRHLIAEKSHLRVDNPVAKELVRVIDHLTIWMFTAPELTKPIRDFMYQESGLTKQDIEGIFSQEPHNFMNAIQSIFSEQSPLYCR